MEKMILCGSGAVGTADQWHWRNHWWGFRLYGYFPDGSEYLCMLELFETRDQAELLCRGSALLAA